MHRLRTGRVIIVGAGVGALYAALNLSPRPVLMISPEELGEGASSAWAQGGVAAAMSEDDSADFHALDTVQAGAGTVDPAVAQTVTEEARAHVVALTELGTPFDRAEDGSYVLSREAAHSFARVVRVQGDQAGAEIMKALIAKVQETPSIQVLEGVSAVGLETTEGVVSGVNVQRATSEGSQTCLIEGAAVLLAGGGSGGLFAFTTNPARIRGEVIGFAARAGAKVADAEFVQFHPTAIASGEDPAPLATEALRGEGAYLINSSGNRFMLDIHEDAELAPRDIVARAIYAERQAGREPALDTRQAVGAKILTEYPSVAEACTRAGIDPVKGTIPVGAAAHYHMGGIETDDRGHASLNGLWVCGEAANTGLHGANRLASNGLLEALVFARRCAEGIDDALPPSSHPVGDVSLPMLGPGNPPDTGLVNRLRQTMTDNVGVVRNGADLGRALVDLQEISLAQPESAILQNMLATATLITASALVREESRGAHFRSDFPETCGDTGARSHMTLDEAMAIRARVVSEIQK